MRSPILPLALLLAILACAGGSATPAGGAAAAAVVPEHVRDCRGTRYVDVRNVLRERAFVRITTNDNRTFFVDRPFEPGEVRRIGVPRGALVRRVDGSTEAWPIIAQGRVAPAEAVRREPGTGGKSMTSQLEMQMGCAEG